MCGIHVSDEIPVVGGIVSTVEAAARDLRARETLMIVPHMLDDIVSPTRVVCATRTGILDVEVGGHHVP
jgi:hypothetical protein